MNVSIEATGLRSFMNLLEQGMVFEVPAGSSVRKVLVTHLGIDPDYLENRIQTLFLNGKPVDDLDAAVVSDGASLALSAAMPGLVGATMRRGGHYAAMRQRIDPTVSALASGKAIVKVTIKLFNMVARDLGRSLFASGVRFPADRFYQYLNDSKADIAAVCRRVTVDGSLVTLEALLSGDPVEADIFLSLRETNP